MLNTVGSSMMGKNVTVDTICLSIDRISAWISASGLLDWALLWSFNLFNDQMMLAALRLTVPPLPGKIARQD